MLEEDLEGTENEESLSEDGEDHSSPGDDTSGEGSEPKLPKKVRDDVYRRLSKSEQANQELREELARMSGRMEELVQVSRERPQVPDGGGQTGSGSEEHLSDEERKELLEKDPERFLDMVIERKLKSGLAEFERSQETKTVQAETRRQLLKEFPELAKPASDFARKADEYYQTLTQQYGTPRDPKEQVMLAQMAAERAAREHPDLRDESVRSRNRGNVERRSSEAALNADGSNLDVGNGRPSKRKDTVEVPGVDTFGAKWFKDIDNPKRRESLKKRVEEAQAMRKEFQEKRSPSP